MCGGEKKLPTAQLGEYGEYSGGDDIAVKTVEAKIPEAIEMTGEVGADGGCKWSPKKIDKNYYEFHGILAITTKAGVHIPRFKGTYKLEVNASANNNRKAQPSTWKGDADLKVFGMSMHDLPTVTNTEFYWYYDTMVSIRKPVNMSPVKVNLSLLPSTDTSSISFDILDSGPSYQRIKIYKEKGLHFGLKPHAIEKEFEFTAVATSALSKNPAKITKLLLVKNAPPSIKTVNNAIGNVKINDNRAVLSTLEFYDVEKGMIRGVPNGNIAELVGELSYIFESDNQLLRGSITQKQISFNFTHQGKIGELSVVFPEYLAKDETLKAVSFSYKFVGDAFKLITDEANLGISNLLDIGTDIYNVNGSFK